MKYNARKWRFVQEYLTDPNRNATAAARRAGYSTEDSARQSAYRLLKDPEVIEMIEDEEARLGRKFEATIERIVQELSNLAFANMMDYMGVTEDGDPYVDLTNVTRDQASAIKSFTVEDYTEGRGENAREVKKVRIELWDKLKAKEMLGNHLGMRFNKTELTGPNGGPIEHRNVDSMKDSDLERVAARGLPSPTEPPHGPV